MMGQKWCIVQQKRKRLDENRQAEKVKGGKLVIVTQAQVNYIRGDPQ